MACDGAFASSQDFASFWCLDCFSGEAEDILDVSLLVTASNIHAALASVNACDCTLASWAVQFLKKLNIVEAAAFHNCRCSSPQLTDEMKRLYLEWSDKQFQLIREGKIDVCAGATGSTWPVIGWASQSLTERIAAEIIANDIRRSG